MLGFFRKAISTFEPNIHYHISSQLLSSSAWVLEKDTKMLSRDEIETFMKERPSAGVLHKGYVTALDPEKWLNEQEDLAWIKIEPSVVEIPKESGKRKRNMDETDMRGPAGSSDAHGPGRVSKKVGHLVISPTSS